MGGRIDNYWRLPSYCFCKRDEKLIILLPYLNDYLSKLGIPPETDHKVKCMASRENIASVHCNVISSSQKSIHGQEQYFKNTKFVHIVHYLSLINCQLSRM